jgi:hypothetical protein
MTDLHPAGTRVVVTFTNDGSMIGQTGVCTGESSTGNEITMHPSRGVGRSIPGLQIVDMDSGDGLWFFPANWLSPIEDPDNEDVPEDKKVEEPA